MKKMKVVLGVALSVIGLIALFLVYMHFRTYTVGKNLKYSDITRVYCMSSMYSSEYGYCYDQYSVGKRSDKYYAETDLFDKESGQQDVITFYITEEEYLDVLRLIEGSKYVREDATNKDRMDGYMDDLNQSADMLFEHMPDGPYELKLSSDARHSFIDRVKELVDSTITVGFVNEVVPGRVWIIQNTEENRRTSVWGTASIENAQLEKEYQVIVRKNSGDSYLLRMIDTDQIYYSADDIPLKEGYSMLIYTSDDEAIDVYIVIYDEDGNELQTMPVFNAAL